MEDEPYIDFSVRELLEKIDKKLDALRDHKHDYVTPRYMWASLVAVSGLAVGVIRFFI